MEVSRLRVEVKERDLAAAVVRRQGDGAVPKEVRGVVVVAMLVLVFVERRVLPRIFVENAFTETLPSGRVFGETGKQADRRVLRQEEEVDAKGNGVSHTVISVSAMASIQEKVEKGEVCRWCSSRSGEVISG